MAEVHSDPCVALVMELPRAVCSTLRGLVAVDVTRLLSLRDYAGAISSRQALSPCMGNPITKEQDMASGPDIKIHSGVAIRYGYCAGDDRYHAHFDLPEKQSTAAGLQRVVKHGTAPRLNPGNYHHWNVSEEALLSEICADIDRYFSG
jgi:hypothetical protein